MRTGVHQNFLEKLILSWWRQCCDVTAIFWQSAPLFYDVTGGSVLCITVFFWYWITKCSSLSSCVTKMSHDVILVKFLPKNAQVLERDLAKLQNWNTSRYFKNFNFSGFIYNEIWLKIKLIWNKNLLVKGLIVKKLEDRQKYVISHECAMRWVKKL